MSVQRTVAAFVHDLRYGELPAEVLDQARRCLLDLVGVAAAGSRTRLSRLMRTHAATHFAAAGPAAGLLFDARTASPPGAALANASTIDSMDGHDGHRLCKGHVGAAVLPAALAFLDGVDTATGADLLAALVVGYEVATRAGIGLHATAADYHSSGAWNALGAAAVGSRILGLDGAATLHSLGIAQYHGPRAPMMAAIGDPSMVKDSSAWGAHAGVTAALLAADGFTGPSPGLLAAPDPAAWLDLGDRWRILEQYFKPYPVCRWAQPAVQAAIDVVTAYDVDPASLRSLTVTTFDPATRLLASYPTTTEQAQYSLGFPVALAAVHRDVPADLVARPDRAGEAVHRLVASMSVQESPALTAAFPDQRRAEVSAALVDGRVLSSGPTTAYGDPESPLSTAALDAKFDASVTPVLGAGRAQTLRQLVRDVERHPVRALGEATR